MKKILSLVLGLLWAVPVLAQENYLSALSLSGTFVTGAEKPYKIPVRVSNGETSQTGYIYANAPVYKLSNYADVVDFQTGKITRNIKKDVFTGAEAWGYSGYAPGRLFIFNNNAKKELALGASNYYPFVNNISEDMPDKSFSIQGYSTTQNGIFLNDKSYTSAAAWKAHLTELYNAGRPLEIYVVTNTPTVEEINLSTLPQMSGNVTYQVIFPEPQIAIATTKYNETKFSPLNTALQNAISVVDTVVSNTITQAGRIATLQAQKQTRPNDIADDNEKCPAGKKCLLVEDASGVPHWYEIVTSRLPDGYTELQYIESTGTQYIDTGIVGKSIVGIEYDFTILNDITVGSSLFGTRLYGNVGSGINFGHSADGKVTVDFFDGYRYTSNLSFEKNTPYRLVVQNNKYTLYNAITGATVDSHTFNATTSDLEYVAVLFGLNNGGSISAAKDSVKVTSCKIYTTNGTVNLVPAKNPDGVVGMYDTDNGVFYENKGTGTFIGGQPVFN